MYQELNTKFFKKKIKHISDNLKPNKGPALKNYSTKGFTIVELLLYMGLLSIILMFLVEIFTQIIDLQLSSRSTSNVSSDGRYIYSRLIYDINRASSINFPTPLGSSSAALGLTIDGDNFTYSLSGNNLVITEASESSNLNSFGTAISDLQFTRIGNSGGKPTVKINYTVTGTTTNTGGRIETEEFETTAGLR